MSLPKVLIISQPFNNETDGGITLSNLFNGWDSDKLAVICTGYVLEFNIDTSICRNYYQLGSKEDKWAFPLSLLKRRYASGPLKLRGRKIQNFTIPKSKTRVKLITKYLFPFLEYTGIYHVARKTTLSPQLCKWLNKFKPDVIYAQAADRSRVNFCMEVQEYLDKPMVYHMMDDWQAVITEGMFKKYWDQVFYSELRALFDHCALLMSICEEMSAEYKRRYNKEFVPFHNPVQMDFWTPYQRKSYELSQAPVLLYAGRIGPGIDSSLKTMAKAIDQVNEELKMSAKFVLQTQPGEKPEWLAEYKCVQHQSFVPYEELPQVLAGADFMMLPYDFAEEPLKYNRYSMPTEATEYMISGTPMIVFGPKETTLVKYAQKYGWAKVITENKAEVVAKAIRELFQNKDERRRIARNAIQVAERNHDSHKISMNFREAICSLTNINERVYSLQLH
jgi:glycosyltransferase involved in cell wall biosynthesis